MPVLLQETIEALRIRPDGWYVDATFGRGGHSGAILARLTSGRLIALDRDPAAIRAGEARFPEALRAGTLRLVKANFVDLGRVLEGLGAPAIDGIVFDLGVSSPQLDDPARGFGYQVEAPLDMRMDPEQPLTAYAIVNGADEATLQRILRDYGEERFFRQIARAIVRARAKAPIRTTTELAEIVKAAIPAPARRTGPHPARRTFQALRIAVNDELEALRRALRQAIDRLRPGGRIAVISFHSLEDRLVKETFRAGADPCGARGLPPELPCGETPMLRLVTRRPIVPGAAEVAANPRARSARLRVAERL
ncbi:16S rRNA (cytosine(1402)-N(4))-methyltransferase RsmH [Hydrogenibacillus schlegelii]|uniref:Ribosomal RNA small subunit methyltransferase H n=2 Tax=Hydrogenibacillus schlegelii TaxID=1484 RepID=A0A132NBP2_HYDSH|nr:16S rRNA (cytosine(1402)-N(4))-methyltransferase RsmH [Hydrogenibacillus schlegelii]KWX07416.1 16S rRNA methyltransferase [Hydrogenibacillus schlegelii]MBT9281549.1 16S rRNA (cytosine(1402)-N(4))-methyltransferase RsmH [Hydrogenibacillus schlegelii]OAR03886.1 ribosomal RNA small subunit methyltransferase H [Hydrogenibacillus schlegelii]PTQ54786.1 MAG: rRNA small subunit methyltransferase H [Hydrogenibacillus schlegelii]